MKRFFIVLIFNYAFSFLFAESVSKEEVHRQAVAACMRIAEDDFSTKPYTITPMLEEGDTCYYVVQFVPEGWALISADDKVQPLIGYSEKGLFTISEVPEAARFWLEMRSKEIQAIKSVKDLKRDKAWDCNTLRSETLNEVIKPFIKVNWDQSKNFSKYCPRDKNGKQTLAGCVAVAMGQAMSVYQYPPRPKGEASYDSSEEVGRIEISFNEESAYDWEKIMSGTDNYDEVARLLYHCGTSVKMKYGAKVSTAQMVELHDALYRNFSFCLDSLRFYVKDFWYNDERENYYSSGNYSDESWTNVILKELRLGRPIIYSMGFLYHAVNIDGFDGVNAFHLNYGWGGASNGYYTLDQMKLGEEVYDSSSGFMLLEEYFIEMMAGLVPVEQSATDIESVANTLETPIQVTGSLLRLKSPEKGICRIYNMSGVLLQTVPIVAGETEISLKTTGICILSVDCNGKVASHKIHVRE